MTDHRVADLRVVLHANVADHRLAPARRAGLGQCAGFAVCRRAQFRQAWTEEDGGAVACVDQLLDLVEIGGTVGAQRRLDEYVSVFQGGELGLGVGASHQGDRLVHHIQHRVQTLAVLQRAADIHRDDHVDAHPPRHVDGDVVDHAAIHQQPAADLHRGEHRGDRHAGADRLRQVAVVEDHLVACGYIGGDGAEGDRQFVEVAGIAGVHQQALQQHRQVLALDHPQRNAEGAVVAEAELLLDQEVAVVLLAAERDVLPGWRIGQRLLPVQAEGDAFQFLRAVAGGVEATDHRSHAGAGDGVDMDALFVQRLQHADMRQPARSPAGKHQADFRPLFGGTEEHG
ncbi:hypothetical protein D9M71_306510 [compost metagenome]